MSYSEFWSSTAMFCLGAEISRMKRHINLVYPNTQACSSLLGVNCPCQRNPPTPLFHRDKFTVIIILLHALLSE
ncbi:Low specificity L-threonine aldolase [Fusarium oxysporum f. sp. albedinis]|nr:Low specificity L-threonine aldolase [Fusarium oxysporum f. sp. albedinis]